MVYGFYMVSGLVCLCSILNCVAQPPESPRTQPDTASGEAAYKRLAASWSAAVANVDPKTKDGFEKETEAFKKVVKTVRIKEARDIAKFIGSHGEFRPSIFDDLLTEYIADCAIGQANSDITEEVLSQVYVETVNGRYIEWELQSRVGNSIKILCDLYKMAKVPQKVDILKALRRALPEVERGDS